MPPAATEKIDGAEVLHAASCATFTAVPLLIVAIAVNWAVSPTTIRLLRAPTIFNVSPVPAEGAVTEAEVGEDEDEPHAMVRLANRMAALATVAGAKGPALRTCRMQTSTMTAATAEHMP